MLHTIHHVFPGVTKEQFQEVLEGTHSGDEVHFHEGIYEVGTIFIPHYYEGLTFTGTILGK